MKNSVSFYLITDSHYFSKQNWVSGEPILHRVREDQIALLHTPEILDAYIEAILADNGTDTVVFLGDNIDGGDMASHYEFRKRLEKLTAAGKRVYITYATHDYIGGDDDECNFQKPRRFTKTGIELTEPMRKLKLPEFYYDFTARDACSVDGESGSYSVKLNEKLLLVCIIDNGNGRSYCGLFDGGMKWLENQLAEAERQNLYVLVCVHHPVLPPWSFYPVVAEREMYGGYKELTQLLCRYGVHAVFTGHTHVQSIRKYENSDGNWFYAVSTSALANALGKMRKITVDCDSGRCDIISVSEDITKKTGVDRETLYRQNFPGICEELLPLAHGDYNSFIEKSRGFLPSDILKKYKLPVKLLSGKICKMSLYGAAGPAGMRRKLTAAEKEKAKQTPLSAVLFEILRHFFAGNAPYAPDTVEYKVVHGLLSRIDRLKIKKLQKLLGGMPLTQAAEDLLHSETGNDDSIGFYLK